jgi:glycosyltransferase 2 family protein
LNADRPGRKWLAAAIKLLIVVVVLWFIRGTVVDAYGRLREHPPRLHFGWLTVSGGLYLAGMVPAGLFWWRVMRALGQDARIGETLRAYVIGHLGKYTPGKAIVVVIRAGMIGSDRVSAVLAAVAVFVETLTMMAVGGCIAAVILAVQFADSPWVVASCLAFAVVSTVPTLPPVFRRLVPMLRVGRSDPQIGQKLSGLNYGVLLAGWLAMGLMWMLWGLSLWACLRGMDFQDIDPIAALHRYTGAIALATVAGFVSMVPGGLGVREVVLAKVLGPFVPGLGESEAVICAALLRLVWLVAEFGISGILYSVGIAYRRSLRRAS